MFEEETLHKFGVITLDGEYVVHVFESDGIGGLDHSAGKVSLVLTPQRLIYASGKPGKFSMRAAFLTDVPYLEIRHRARQFWYLVLGIALIVVALVLIGQDDRTLGDISSDPLSVPVIGAAVLFVGAVVALYVFFMGGRTELASGPSTSELSVGIARDHLEDARDFVHAFFVAKMNQQKAIASV